MVADRLIFVIVMAYHEIPKEFAVYEDVVYLQTLLMLMSSQ